MKSSEELHLDGFLAKYSPAIEKLARQLRQKLQKRLRGSVELVYDNYNALAIGYGPSEKTSEAIFSLALYPKWVSLFFLQARGLSDPEELLKGKGKVVRHIVLDVPSMLDEPAVQGLVDEALRMAARPIDAKQKSRLVIKSVSAKQRPRRPADSRSPGAGAAA